MARSDRLAFLDALRGLAIVLMVLNHTARWWIDRPMGWLRYQLIYVTLTLAAPLFLFLLGFCLPLSFARVRGDLRGWARVAAKYVRRALGILAAGYLLNAALFPEDAVYAGGVLHTLGLGILLSLPLLPLLDRLAARVAVLAAAVVAYVAFVPMVPRLMGWIPDHPVAGHVWFFDFAPWPWLALVLIGLVLGRSFAADQEARDRLVVRLGVAGLLALAVFTVWELTRGPVPHIHFQRDFTLNRHWIPRGTTLAWVLGAIGAELALLRWLVDVRGLRLTWLVILGRSSLMIYLVHQAIVLAFARHLIPGGTFTHWWAYWLANALLLAALVGLAAAWQAFQTWRHGLLVARPVGAA